MTKHHEDEKTLAKAKADKLAQDEAEADAYGDAQVAEPWTAEPEVEPERFRTGGATAAEIAAWREAHGTPADANTYAPGTSVPEAKTEACE